METVYWKLESNSWSVRTFFAVYTGRVQATKKRDSESEGFISVQATARAPSLPGCCLHKQINTFDHLASTSSLLSVEYALFIVVVWIFRRLFPQCPGQLKLQWQLAISSSKKTLYLD
jgi:hypothetical protein